MSTVLIVDDALFMRKKVRDALEPFGFKIIGEAQNGKDAVKKFEELNPDVITLDIVMPEMDGIEVLAKIREKNKSIPIIMITAIDQRESMLKAMKLGITDFIVKPFDNNRVVSAVQKAVQRTKGNI
ncbi:MAG: response regulator [Desulfobacterales bacterium]|nr:response regulator [Desulfobacterales bacterium]MBF0397434.1 response regulator [Desulfobacterales bacterium]